MNTVLDYAFYFFFYSIAGWILETVCCSLYYRKIANRGFLKGPVCPIYGTAAVVLGVCLMPFYDKFGYTWYIIPIVILLGVVIANTVEFLTSYVMEKLFHARWWDYSNEFLNIQGRICLKHSIYWAICTGAFIYIVHPFVIKQINLLLTNEQRNIILVVALIIFSIDLVFTLIAAKKKKLRNTVTANENHEKETQESTKQSK